jgi:hypothetical protein
MEHETNVSYCESRTLKTNSSTFPQGGSAVKAKIHTSVWKKSAIDTRMVSVTQKNIIPNLVLKDNSECQIPSMAIFWFEDSLIYDLPTSIWKYMNSLMCWEHWHWHDSVQSYNKGHAEYALGNAGMQFKRLKISSRNMYINFPF